MKDILIFGYTLKELFPTLIKVGFVIGLALGVYLLIKY